MALYTKQPVWSLFISLSFSVPRCLKIGSVWASQRFLHTIRIAFFWSFTKLSTCVVHVGMPRQYYNTVGMGK